MTEASDKAQYQTEAQGGSQPPARAEGASGKFAMPEVFKVFGVSWVGPRQGQGGWTGRGCPFQSVAIQPLIQIPGLGQQLL